MARPRKTLAEVLRDRTFRADRHADRLAAAQSHAPGELPARPKGLSAAARRAWDQLVPQLVGVAGERDVANLRMLVEAAAEHTRLVKRLAKFEPETPEYGRIVRAMKKVFDEFSALAAKYGLDPISRERLPAVEMASAEDIERLKLIAKFNLGGEGDAARAKLRRLGVLKQSVPTRPKTKLDEAGNPNGQEQHEQGDHEEGDEEEDDFGEEAEPGD